MLIGSVSICFCVTMPDTSDLVTSTTVAAAVTVTDSASDCTFSEKSCRTSRPMVRTMPVRSSAPKPESSAFRV